MNEERRKVVGKATHNLDQAQATLTEMIQCSEDILGTIGIDAGERIAILIHHLRLAGFGDPSQTKESVEFLRQQLSKNEYIIHVIAAGAYCGLMQATLALPKYQDT